MKLENFPDLAAAKAYSTTKGKMISPDIMVAFLATFGIGRAVEIEDSEAAFAFRKTLQFGSEFNLMNGHPANVKSLLDQIAAATPEFKAYVVNYANPTVYPFFNATIAQFNMAKGLYTSNSVTLASGNDIIVTVNTPLTERVAATVWRVEAGFSPENAGRNIHVQDAIKYRIDMSGKKSGEYEVRIPFENADFAVEAV
jgi:hypothetical protein